MISIRKEGNIIYTTASEKLDDDDYNQLMPVVEDAVGKFGKIKWYFEMDGFEGWTFSELWKDVKFDIAHAKHMEKVAMVGEKTWQNWMTKLMKPFTAGDTKYFDLKAKEEALDWIKA